MSERIPSSPKSGLIGRKRESTANRVAELILQSCRSVDSSAHISSVLRDSEGRTIVRVRADPRNDPNIVLGALKALWPLARSSVHENSLDGIVEAEITVPRERDEQKRAWNRARKSKRSEFLFMLFLVLFLMSVISYSSDCYDALVRRTNASFDSGSASSGAHIPPASSAPASSDTKQEL